MKSVAAQRVLSTTARVIRRGSLEALREPWNSKAIESHSRKRGEWKSRPRHKPFPDKWIRQTHDKTRAVVLGIEPKLLIRLLHTSICSFSEHDTKLRAAITPARMIRIENSLENKPFASGFGDESVSLSSRGNISQNRIG